MVTRSCLDDSFALLRAAQYTVDTYVKSGMFVGLGSGHASGMAIQHLGRQLRTGNLKDIPYSEFWSLSAMEISLYNGNFNQTNELLNLNASVVPSLLQVQIDFAFDDADAIEEGTLVAIIGQSRLDIF
ncbi:probable ribose-5-phosphate isomerase 4, chloroplastic [Arachis hypogaea]|uniref:probable ribose-5-phosphate isomerase 4, chloroplastic n=1 Tax=Arachis hypogaea TaxID=3818 RepID=UPI000DEC8818|nr:probable ribose-5-phosphate isomerase 4, chloroplastic [Arachis hypogaea]